jgi:dTDP-4-amino-4,6-dideoxy-D-galactose acyltransferase
LMKIKKLEWDSTFFNLNIGELSLLESTNLNIDSIKPFCLNFDLVYVFSSGSFLNPVFFESQKIELELVLSKKDSNIKKNENIYSCQELSNDLIKLSYECGKHSRFKLDSKFSTSDFENLYKVWIEKSIEREICDEVFVYKIEDQIVGFVTIKIKDLEAEIGLIAVDLKYQGIGIGQGLIDSTINYSLRKGIKKIVVSTQGNNLQAIAFYTRKDFKITKTKIITHLWA